MLLESDSKVRAYHRIKFALINATEIARINNFNRARDARQSTHDRGRVRTAFGVVLVLVLGTSRHNKKPRRWLPVEDFEVRTLLHLISSTVRCRHGCRGEPRRGFLR